MAAANFNPFGPGVDWENGDGDGLRRLYPIRLPGDPDDYVWRPPVSLGANDQEMWKEWQRK